MMRKLISMLLVSILCAVYSSYPSWNSFNALYHWRQKSFFADTAVSDISLQRKIQKDFQKYGVHISLSDIFINNRSVLDSSLFDQLGVPNDRVVVWVPLVFRIPVFGSWTYEWVVSK